MKKEIEISNPEKLLPWLGASFMASWILEGVILLIGFTSHLLFVNYFSEALFLVLFCLSCKNKYERYKEEPNLKITLYFWIELLIHSLFIVGAVVQSALNVWIDISQTGLHYRHEYFFVSLMILVAHIIFMCIDYYATEKAAAIRYCKRIKKKK